MSRSTGTKSQDTPFPDGMIPLLPGADLLATGASGANALTRIAAGEFSLRATDSGGTYVIMGGVSSIVFRTGVQDDALSSSARFAPAVRKTLPLIVRIHFRPALSLAPVRSLRSTS